jgi:hypothetical protein
VQCAGCSKEPSISLRHGSYIEPSCNDTDVMFDMVKAEVMEWVMGVAMIMMMVMIFMKV